MYFKEKANTFYIYTSLFVIAGWLWFLWSSLYGGNDDDTVCLFRNITGHPCPACGSTTSVGLIFKGDFVEALAVNPLGYLVVTGLLLLPLWLMVDLFFRKRTMYNALLAFDRRVKRQPWIILVILMFVVLNWIMLYSSFLC